MVVEGDHEYLLGVTLVGPGVAELLHSATIAVAAQIPIDRLLARRAVLPHDQRGLAAPARGLPRLTSTVLDKPRKPEATTAHPGCAG